MALPTETRAFSKIREDWHRLMAKVRIDPLIAHCFASGEYVTNALP
jgi:hypothetical protein